MDAQHWLIGPQLIGIILLLVGIIQKRYPPRNINPLYGYRTHSSMKSQQAWDAANRYSARYMIKAGIILLLLGLAFSITLGVIEMPDENRMLIAGVVLVAVSIITCVLLIVYTEKHLSKTFDNQS